jgi:hypothetical protein
MALGSQSEQGAGFAARASQISSLNSAGVARRFFDLGVEIFVLQSLDAGWCCRSDRALDDFADPPRAIAPSLAPASTLTACFAHSSLRIFAATFASSSMPPESLGLQFVRSSSAIEKQRIEATLAAGSWQLVRSAPFFASQGQRWLGCRRAEIDGELLVAVISVCPRGSGISPVSSGARGIDETARASSPSRAPVTGRRRTQRSEVFRLPVATSRRIVRGMIVSVISALQAALSLPGDFTDLRFS